MPKVLNKRTDVIPKDAVYIGRPSIWGNPFTIGKDGTREEVILKYDLWIATRPDLAEKARKELRGKDLVCWCSPKPCHGDSLLMIANAEEVLICQK